MLLWFCCVLIYVGVVGVFVGFEVVVAFVVFGCSLFVCLVVVRCVVCSLFAFCFCC